MNTGDQRSEILELRKAELEANRKALEPGMMRLLEDGPSLSDGRHMTIEERYMRVVRQIAQTNAEIERILNGGR